MSNILRTITVAGFALLVAGPALAQSSSATATANATANVVAAIAISKTTDMDFGKVVTGATLGTVVLSTAGARSATGGTKLGNAGATAAAAFSVSGESGATYAITLPTSSTLTSGANNMTVNTFTSNPSATGTLTGGTQALAVGATLNVGASQASGAYTGTFDVTVAYN